MDMKQETAVAESKPKPLATVAPSFMEPRNLSEAMALAGELAKSNIVPKEFEGKPSNILIAFGFGGSVGLNPMQSLQSICVINGKPSMWGDAVLGVVKASGLEEYTEETYDPKTLTATCTTKRRGDPVVVVRSFSMEEAKKAGLTGKDSWTKYPTRMLQMRARAWAMRDKYPDLLKGLQVREEVEDYVDTDATEEPVLRKSEISSIAAKIVDHVDASLSKDGFISVDQRRELLDLSVAKGLPPAAISEHLKTTYGIESSAQLPKDKFEDVKAWLNKP